MTMVENTTSHKSGQMSFSDLTGPDMIYTTELTHFYAIRVSNSENS